MTEREIWKALADDCAERLVARDDFVSYPGLCIMIPRLAECTEDTTDAAYAKIELERERLGQHGPYIWPRHDIQSRLDFCNRMIKELDDAAKRHIPETSARGNEAAG